MMGKIWLVICGNDELARLRGEVLDRDAGARFLRFEEVDALLDMARAFAGEQVGAAVGCRVLGSSELEEAVRALARLGTVRDVLVLAEHADWKLIAGYFACGATEVITAAGAVPTGCQSSLSQARVGREPQDAWGAGAPAADAGTVPGPVPQPGSEIAWDGELEPAAGEELAAGAASLAAAGATSLGDAVVDDGPPWDVPAPMPPAVGNVAVSGASQGAAPPAAGGAPAGGPGDAAAADVAAGQEPGPAAGKQAHRAPLVAVISGRGGVGKTTLVAAMAACAARAGLRAAVLDLDLMFGNLYTVLGAAGFKGLEGVGAHAHDGELDESDIEAAAMRIGPGLTLWGPCEEPERAELMADSAEQLIEVLRDVADVIFVDTSVQWGDAVAMAVGACDRCLVVGSAGTAVVGSTKRAMALAGRIGVPTTRMTGVFNRVGARDCGEEQAMHFEIGISLRSRVRIPDGGEEVAGMLSFGQVDKLVAGSSAFAKSVRQFTGEMLRELGCPIDGWLLDEEQRRAAEADRGRIRLPWRQKAGAVQ